jgi:hypothetical protein
MDTAVCSSHAGQKEQDMFRTISQAALFTGTLDIIAANIHFYIDNGTAAGLKLPGSEGAMPFFSYLAHGGMCKYIAGAVFGDPAGAGGALMIVWGIVFHYIIAFLFTAFLFVIYTRMIKRLQKKSIVAIIYGLFIWMMMNLLVIPLSKINKFPSDPINALAAFSIVTLLIGWPVCVVAHRFYARKGLV